MINFAAIDFETANGKRTSVCSVGVVIVREGKITNKIYRLIRPRPNYYTQWTTAVHGLTYDDTMEADEFPEVWAEIKPLIDGLPLVAHNSPFDEGCLRAVHELYDMTFLIISFIVLAVLRGKSLEKICPIISCIR